MGHFARTGATASGSPAPNLVDRGKAAASDHPPGHKKKPMGQVRNTQSGIAQKQKAEKSLRGGLVIRQRRESPVDNEPANPAGGCDEDAARYAMTGRRVSEVAMANGTIKAKARNRDERRSHYSEQKWGHQLHSGEDAFGVTLAHRCRRGIERSGAYYRPG